MQWKDPHPKDQPVSDFLISLFESESVSCSVVSDSLQCHGLYVACQAPLFMDYQVIILEWVAIPFSRGSSWPKDWTQVSCIAGSFFTVWAIRYDDFTVYYYLIWTCHFTFLSLSFQLYLPYRMAVSINSAVSLKRH